MARGVDFSIESWLDYSFWRRADRALFIKLTQTIEDCRRNPFEGIGKPERLRHDSNRWSRRLDQKNRIIYSVTDARILLHRCVGHYGDK